MIADKIHLSVALFIGITLAYVDGADLCIDSSDKGDVLDCVLLGSRYFGSQWAVRASERDFPSKEDFSCHGTHRWVPCMEITHGKREGFISKECSCDRSNRITKRTLDIPLKCYLPGNAKCSWFSDCLAPSVLCPNGENADPLGSYLCDVFETHSNNLSADGNIYISNLKQCLKRRLYHLILPGSIQNCTLRVQYAESAYKQCVSKRSLEKEFCELPTNDQSCVFWTLRSVLTKAFGPLTKTMLQDLRKCYAGNTKSPEKKIMITVDIVNVTSFLTVDEEFADIIGWSQRDIAWHGYLMPQISDSVASFNVIFKPNHEFDLAYEGQTSAAIDIDRELNAIKTELMNNNLGVSGVFYDDGEWAYFTDIGLCPFHVRGGGIFDLVLPEPLPRIDVKFYLYRRGDSDTNTETLDFFDDDMIINSSYNGSQKTYFIVHGFINDGKEEWIKEMRSAILEKEDCNVVVVDWSKGANSLSATSILYLIPFYIESIAVGVTATVGSVARTYLQSAVNTRLVGCYLGKLVEKLNLLKNTNYGDVHMIGHSLGAHLSGFAGFYLNSQIGRITGMDPAGPGYTGLDEYYRIDRLDAIFVDIIHTNTALFGIPSEVGHIDFYPEGGRYQPGCYALGCSHGRSYELLTESISSTCEFWACQCTRDEYDDGDCSSGRNCTTMGFWESTDFEGSFYLDTHRQSPFCTGKLPETDGWWRK